MRGGGPCGRPSWGTTTVAYMQTHGADGHKGLLPLQFTRFLFQKTYLCKLLRLPCGRGRSPPQHYYHPPTFSINVASRHKCGNKVHWDAPDYHNSGKSVVAAVTADEAAALLRRAVVRPERGEHKREAEHN